MTIRLAAAAFALAAFTTLAPAFAQTPYLVADLNTTPDEVRSSHPEQFQLFGDTLFFSAATEVGGRELWMHSAGGGTSMVADIAPGPSNSTPRWLTDIGGGVFLFRASDLNHGAELWRTDGTPAGTTLVRDIRPGGSSLSDPQRTAVYGGRMFFVANDGVHGAEPWVSDGTEAGTEMLLDLDGTSTASNVTILRVVDDQLFIFGAGALWTSDGTAGGTTRIATVGEAWGTARIGSTLFFTATGTGESGRELWKTDGSAAGTQMVIDLAPGAGWGLGTTSSLTAIGSTLYFTAAADQSGADLWKTDGTAAGTELVKTLLASGTPNPVAVTLPDGKLYLELNGTIWSSDGTAAGTMALDSNAYNLVSAFGRIYYFRTLSITELWTSDGVTNSLVLSIPSAFSLTSTGGKLYFNGSDEHGYEPWISEDGTAATTHRLANVGPELVASSDPADLTADGDVVFFRAHDGTSPSALYRSDGTASGTFPLAQSTNPNELTGWHGAAYFIQSGSGFWRSDGTVAGTAMMKDFTEEGSSGWPSKLYPGSRYLFFRADMQVWRADGTPSGLMSVSEGLAYRHTPYYPSAFAELAGRVYIGAETNPPGIWVTDGDAATTARIFTVPNTNATISNLTTAAGAVFFSTITDGAGEALWRSDGTFGSGALMKDIAGNAVSTPTQLTPVGRDLYFVAVDATHGAELWRSDGTQAGTFLVKDIIDGAPSSSISSLTAAGELLYFLANDGTHGAELWRTDGTSDGTVMVADLRPGNSSSNPAALAFAHGSLWFSADDGIAGTELWRTVGDVPVMVADLMPGPDSSSPSKVEQAGTLLFFGASTSLGRELWALSLTDALFSIDDVRATEGTGGTRTLRFTVERSGSATGAASVAFTTMDGTASADDYVARSGTVTFADGETTQFVDIAVQSDALIEGPESLFVTLASPSNAGLGKSVGTGIIDDDDQRAELSIVALHTASSLRYFQITNAGPSAATNVRLRFSESPRDLTFNFSGLCASFENPATCTLDSILPGGIVDFQVDSSAVGYVDPNAHPGSTVTATISAAELDSNPNDNVASNMFSRDGALSTLMLPPFLTTNTTVTANFKGEPFLTSGQSVTVSLTSSWPNVVVSPSFIIIPQGQTSATFELTIGDQAGPVKLTASPMGWPPVSLMIQVVAPGGIPKLDVAMVATTISRVDYGEEAKIEAGIAARRHDGTLPTGTVSLLDENLNVVAQQTLDSAAKAVFTQSDLPVGRHTFVVRYHGDTNFNGLDGPETLIIVDGLRTTVSIAAAPVVCAGTAHEVIATVRSLESSEAPTGSVQFLSSGGTSPVLALTPSGVPGESRASWTASFSSGIIYAEYSATGAFASSSESKKVSAHSCVAFDVQATATSATSVTLNWAPIAGSTRYQVHRYQNDLSWIMVGTLAPGTTRTETGLVPMRSYLYVVDYYNDTDYLGSSAPDVATTLLFDDDPIVARATTVRASHIEQLRMGANALRWYGLASDISVIAPVPVGSPIRAEHITALRTDMNAQRRALGLPVIAFTEPVLAPGAPIKGVHIEELRNAVK